MKKTICILKVQINRNSTNGNSFFEAFFKGEYHGFWAKGGSENSAHFRYILGITKIIFLVNYFTVNRSNPYLVPFSSVSVLSLHFWRKSFLIGRRFSKIPKIGGSENSYSSQKIKFDDKIVIGFKF